MQISGKEIAGNVPFDAENATLNLSNSSFKTNMENVTSLFCLGFWLTVHTFKVVYAHSCTMYVRVILYTVGNFPIST